MGIELRDRVKRLFGLKPVRVTNDSGPSDRIDAPSPYEAEIKEAYSHLQALRRKCKDFQNHVYAAEVSNPRIEFLDEDELSEVKRSAREMSGRVVAEVLPGDVKSYGTLLGDYTSVLMEIKYSASVGDDPSLLNTEQRIMDFKKEITGLIDHLDHEMANYDAQSPFQYPDNEDQVSVLSGP